MRQTNPVFIPDSGDRKGVASLLVSSAKSNGLDARSVRAVQGGFYITEDLAGIIYGGEPEPEPVQSEPEQPEAEAEAEAEAKPKKKRRTTKTSGNRAEKNDQQQPTDNEE